MVENLSTTFDLTVKLFAVALAATGFELPNVIFELRAIILRPQASRHGWCPTGTDNGLPYTSARRR
jgi:hypothetical protein